MGKCNLTFIRVPTSFTSWSFKHYWQRIPWTRRWSLDVEHKYGICQIFSWIVVKNKRDLRWMWKNYVTNMTCLTFWMCSLLLIATKKRALRMKAEKWASKCEHIIFIFIIYFILGEGGVGGLFAYHPSSSNLRHTLLRMDDNVTSTFHDVDFQSHSSILKPF